MFPLTADGLDGALRIAIVLAALATMTFLFAFAVFTAHRRQQRLARLAAFRPIRDARGWVDGCGTVRVQWHVDRRPAASHRGSR